MGGGELSIKKAPLQIEVQTSDKILENDETIQDIHVI